jgi:hypothetical protein
MIASHIKIGFKRFGIKKGFLSLMWEQVKRISSTKNQVRMAMRNMKDNGDGTFSFVRPHSYKEVGE